MKPIYCPNCGKPITDYVSYWVNSDWIGTPENPFYGIGYDCYCKNCQWSGEIESDIDMEIKHKLKELKR